MELKFTEKRISSIVKELADDDTLIITDLYGYSILSSYGRTVLVRNNQSEKIEEIKKENEYSKVLAIGGCTALDVGRAYAVDKEVITIPTILSTSCISVDRSIIEYEDGSKLEKTIAPVQTIISIPSVSETHIGDLEKWSQSGFGDLFANISASIDMQYKRKNLSLDAVRKNVPECFEALEWVINSFESYDRNCLTKLAKYLHNSSLIVIERDDTELSAAGEHKLYHKMIEQQEQYAEDRPTHGQIVATGTLIAVKIFGEQIGDQFLYEKFTKAYEKLGLPINYSQLRKIGIEKEHLIQGLESITENYLDDYFAKGDYAILDKIFGGKR